ncbi:MAG: glycoside hydrolase family 99-like domain-containing protein [Candidatus Bathyarchaeia archaeon]
MGPSSKLDHLRPSELGWKGETRRLLGVSRSIFREQGLYSLLLAAHEKLWIRYRKPKPAQIGAFRELYQSMLSVAESHANPGTQSDTEKLDSRYDDRVKLIAFYLPQFHPIPENDAWWGTGFTEWTNVTKAVPQFVGHYQPRLPGELGFYDLRVIDVQKRQVELARQYGIYGFCFYYYWFDGKPLLERPLNQFLSHKKINFHFCLCWANENWTRRWDGQENQRLKTQTYPPGWEIQFIKSIENALLDKRYIRIRGKPLLIVYNPRKLPAPNTVQKWRNYWRAQGNGDLYVVAARTFGFNADPRTLGYDAAVDFPPHNILSRNATYDVKLLNPRFLGEVFDYGKFVERQVSLRHRKYPFDLFRTVFPSWDNEPRRAGRGHIFAFSTPELYAKWLRLACERTIAELDVDKGFVFINAWNEWAEGAYLEPDRKYGRAYLQATAAVLKSLSRNNFSEVT